MRSTGLMIVLAALLGLIMFASLGIGAVRIPPRAVADALLWPDQLGTDRATVSIIRDLRLIRILLAVFVGGGLAVAGAAYQGLFQNALADPFVIGASSGAALGVAITINLGLDVAVLWFTTIPLGAFIGSLLTVAVVYSLAGTQGSVAPLTLLLAGASVSSFVAALVSMMMLLTDKSLIRTFSWLMGSVAGHGWPVFWTAATCILLGCIILQMMARPLDALSFGEETARSLGLPLATVRGIIVVAATLVTAASVAAAGIIGFIGLVAPHVARLFVGAHHALLLPVSGLIGAILLLLADDLARTVAVPLEVPLGIITALLGGPFFLVLLKQYHRRLGG